MQVGDAEYVTKMARYRQLYWQDRLTAAEGKEIVHLNLELTAAELQGKELRALVSDYDLMMNAGDLGGVEL